MNERKLRGRKKCRQRITDTNVDKCRKIKRGRNHASDMLMQTSVNI
jgi:hypothetical protein